MLTMLLYFSFNQALLNRSKVEGELGVLAGVEDEVSHAAGHYTRPEEVEDFVKKTGVDR